jgi:hypothetical protein
MSLPSIRSGVSVFLLVLAAGQPAGAQQQPAQRDVPYIVSWSPQPKIELMLAAANMLVVRDSYRVDNRTAFGMAVSALVVTGHTSDTTRLKGVRIDLNENNKPGEAGGSSLLDLEEATALSRSLTAIIDLSNRGNRDDRRATEASFTSLGGFVVGFRQDFRGQTAYVLSGRGTDAIRTVIDIKELPTMKSLVDEALALLATK